MRNFVSSGAEPAGLRRRLRRRTPPPKRSTSAGSVQIGFAAVWIHADDSVAPIGEVNLIEARALQAEGLRGACFAQRERPVAIGIDDFNATCGGSRGGGPARSCTNESTSRDPLNCSSPERYRAVRSTNATKTGCKGRSLVRLSSPEVKQQYTAFADLLFEEEGCAVSEPRRHSCLRRIDRHA